MDNVLHHGGIAWTGRGTLRVIFVWIGRVALRLGLHGVLFALRVELHGRVVLHYRWELHGMVIFALELAYMADGRISV